jgi:micrococcal nuclease
MHRKFLLIIILCLVCTMFSCIDETVQEGFDQVTVVKVVDGDTIRVRFPDGTVERVRLIGIDTPEVVHPRKPVEHFGREASEYTKKHLENKIIHLSYDQNKRDRFGRLLAYVWINDTLYNNQIIRDGYAFAYTKFPFKDEYMEMFRESERYARINNRGLWAEKDDNDNDNDE